MEGLIERYCGKRFRGVFHYYLTCSCIPTTTCRDGCRTNLLCLEIAVWVGVSYNL